MEAHEGAKRGNQNQLLTVLTVLLAAALLLPGLASSLFGWISGLLAIPVFCLLSFYGTRQGTILVRNGAILATVAAIILNQLPSTLFSLSLFPLGFSLSRSAALKEDEIKTSFKGIIVLGVSWLIFWSAYSSITGINPYSQLQQVLDTGFAQTYELYSSSSEVPVETLVKVEQAVAELRMIIPKVLPGILICTVVLTVYINLLGCITLLRKLNPEIVTWKKYREWRLPDKLVWVLIASGIATFTGEGAISSIGFSLVLVSILLYFFQGLAVFINFTYRWKIPPYLKILIYGILIIQSYGLLLLSVIGIADVWIDFRQRQNKNDQPEN